MNYDNYVDAPVFDQNGDKIGNISHLYYTVDEHVPEWATVRSGLFGMSKHFVPLWDAHETEDGVVINNVTEEMVKNAPSVEDEDETSDEDDARLRNYYKYNDEAINGRQSDPSEAEPMPNVEMSERHQGDETDQDGFDQEQTSAAAPERRLLHRYIVQEEGGKKWAADVVVERTPIDDDQDENTDRDA